MAVQAQVEAAQPVSPEGVGAALQDHCPGLEDAHHFRHDRLEQSVERRVVDALAEGDVDAVAAASALPDCVFFWFVGYFYAAPSV